MNKTIMILVAACAAFALFPFTPAAAQSRAQMNEASIRAFYGELPGMFKKPLPAFAAGYVQRIHPNLTYTSRTRVIFPDKSSLDNEPINAKYDDLIRNVPAAYESARAAQLSNTVEEITIGEDKKSARVVVTSTVRNMSIPGPDGKPARANSTELCNDDLVLNDGVIQILNSSCAAELQLLR